MRSIGTGDEVRSAGAGGQLVSSSVVGHQPRSRMSGRAKRLLEAAAGDTAAKKARKGGKAGATAKGSNEPTRNKLELEVGCDVEVAGCKVAAICVCTAVLLSL